MATKLKVTDTTLRDAHQSLWATRMKTEDMLPIADKLDNAGYYSLEVWGGATFDVCLRYLQEDPWERLRLLKRYLKKTPLQMLLRGQNLVGYQHYPDDVVQDFVAKSAEHGIDIFRIFDALNDSRNLETSINAVKRAGKHAQATVVYTLSPVHTREHYVETAKELAQMGADSLCIKDMAGLLMPFEAYELVKAMKKNLSIPVHVHSHYMGGMAMVAYLKAIDAGADGIDTASAALAFGPSQPPVETITRFMQGSPRDPGLYISDLFEISRYFDNVRKKYGYSRGVTRINDMRVFDHQVPGGMITNLVKQLEQQNALNRLHEVLEEIPQVRADLGYPPLVTPTSQIVGTQAVLNVLTNQRYKVVPNEVKAYFQGYYGKPPAPVDSAISKEILGDVQPIGCRPADLLEPKMAKAREELFDVTQNEEDILSYALFGQVALKYFESRVKRAHENELETLISSTELGTTKAAPAEKEAEDEGQMNLKELKELLQLMGEAHLDELNLESEGMNLSIKRNAGSMERRVSPEDASRLEKANPVAAHVKEKDAHAEDVQVEKLVQVTSPMVGTFYSKPAPDAAPFAKVGDLVAKGQKLCIIEAMKLMNEIEADAGGKIVSLLVEDGAPVEFGQPLFLIEKQT